MAYHELKITIPEEAKNQFIAFFAAKGSLGFVEDDSGLIAYFPDSFDMKELVRELDLMRSVLDHAGLRDQLKVFYSLIPDQDWNESWKINFKPLDVGDSFTILPPWEKKRDNRINLIIDPGMAFGTGHHETTRSCLVLMEKYNKRVVKERFLDLGTGTGLLAIAASKLGYEEVVAVDTDPLATDAARMNIRLNEVTNVVLRDGSITEAPGRYDCISANIISGVLILLAQDIASRMNPSGVAILSGILSEQAAEVSIAMQKADLTIIESYPDDKWISLVVQRR